VSCLTDVTQFDSGNYTCEIRGPYSSILGQSNHHLFVRGTYLSALLSCVGCLAEFSTETLVTFRNVCRSEAFELLWAQCDL